MTVSFETTTNKVVEYSIKMQHADKILYFFRSNDDIVFYHSTWMYVHSIDIDFVNVEMNVQTSDWERQSGSFPPVEFEDFLVSSMKLYFS